MNNLILTVGISNSGKTTWTKDYCKASNGNTCDINRDDIREALYGKLSTYKFKKAKEAKVTETQLKMADIAVSEGLDIIISDTNLNEKTRKTWITFAKENGYTFEYQFFFTEPHICIARSLKREYTVPPWVINRQYVQFRKFVTERGYGKLPTYSPNTAFQKALIFDVDGTLADMTGLRKPFEWDKVSLDKPRDSVIKLAQQYSRMGYKIIVMSGRDGCCYEDTRQWLTDNGVPTDLLYMRRAGDDRPDCIIKEELFWGHDLHKKFNIEFVVDDRQQMVDRWRAIGLQCWQVQEGNF